MGNVYQEATAIVEKYSDGSTHRVTDETFDEATNEALWAARWLLHFLPESEKKD